MITWNTDCNAPCCPGEIVNDDGRRILIQTDWDYPGTAQTFGWSLQDIAKCQRCGKVSKASDMIPVRYGSKSQIEACECQYCGESFNHCDHDGTDGTVPCKDCGLTQSDFISAAYDWLKDNDGASVEDPGYFDN